MAGTKRFRGRCSKCNQLTTHEMRETEGQPVCLCFEGLTIRTQAKVKGSTKKGKKKRPLNLGF